MPSIFYNHQTKPNEAAIHIRDQKLLRFWKAIGVVILMFLPFMLNTGPTREKTWQKVAKHYYTRSATDFTTKNYEIAIYPKNIRTPKFHYQVNLAVDNKNGLYISTPTDHHTHAVRSQFTIPLLPIHLSWQDIEECIPYKDNVIIMPIKDTNYSIELPMWKELSPACRTNGILTH